MSSFSRSLWENVPSNPDLEADLGYQTEPLTVIQVSENDSQIIILPREESQLEEDEFIVTDSDTVESLDEWL